MKLLASLLITVSLIAGALAAATAYLAPLSLPDEKLVGLVLSAPAGVIPADADAAYRQRLAESLATPASDGGARADAYFQPPRSELSLPDHPAIQTQMPAEAALALQEDRRPIAPAESVLTPGLLSMLRDGGVEAVKVKSFSLRRWRSAWIFGVAALGLLVGAFLLRKAAASVLVVVPGGARAEGTVDGRTALENVRAALGELEGELGRMRASSDERARLAVILRRLSALQEGPLAMFIADRPRLIARLGLGGYASLMDRFATGERQVNRAWSAAADGYLDEAESCLTEAQPLFEEAIARLGAS